MATSTPQRARRPVPRMDPRIKARRIEVRRGEGRRRLQRLADLGAVVLVAAGFAVALRSPLLDVDRIVVTGAARTGADAVLGDLGIRRGDPLIDVDLGAAGARVSELPWVHEVALHRRVDGVVEVAVTERTPVALVQSTAGDLLVDASGRVLGPPASGGPDVGPLPRVVGVPGALQPGDQLPGDAAGALQVAGALGAAAPGAVTEVRAGRADIRATLATGGEVRLGRAERVDAKVRSLATMLEQVDLTCLAALDLRLPGSPVLTRDDACS